MTTGTQHQPPPPSQQQPATTVATDAIPGSPSMMATTAPQLKPTTSLAGKKRPAPSSSSASENNDNNNDGSSSSNNNNNINKPQPQPLNRVGKDGEPLSEKKLRRLEKNRLSARECRRRKREATENMQGQINQLEGENLRLRLQLQVGEEAEQTNHQKQIDSTKALDELLKSGKASESEIYAKIEEYKEKFADYGRDRRSAMEFHLKNVDRLLMPTQTTSFIMSTLKDSDEISGSSNSNSDSNGNGGVNASSANQVTDTDTAAVSQGGPLSTSSSSMAVSQTNTPKTSKELFTLLVKKLEVTPAQASALKDSRFVAQEMDGTLQETLQVLKELRGRLAQCGQDLETEFNCIRQILTPSQSAKFLVWVAQNKACMHMLNELWSKNYPSMSIESGDGSSSIPMTPLGSGSFDSTMD